MSPLQDIARNHIFIKVVIAWVVAQGLKIALGVLQRRRFDFRFLLETGGMPSTHAAGVTALAVSVGMEMGFDSVLFAVAMVFTMITLFDAQGVRRSAGIQARILNRLLEDIYFKRRIPDERVKEFFGHTPVQVFGGMAVGLVVALLM